MEAAKIEVKIDEQFGRVKGASWFPLLHKKDVLVLGQGGIGSWVALLLSRIGCTLHLYDMDNYEIHNMTGQVVRRQDVGKNKAETSREIIGELSPSAEVFCYGKYELESPSNDIVICGFDQMLPRKVAFSNWEKYVDNLPADQRRLCFFQDGRLLAEHLQVFTLTGDNIENRENYRKEWLFDDEEVADVECTFKQTSHAAAMIGSHMVTFLTNWIFNVNQPSGTGRRVPYKYEYLLPINLSI